MTKTLEQKIKDFKNSLAYVAPEAREERWENFINDLVGDLEEEHIEEKEKLKQNFLAWIDSDEFYDLLPGDGVDDWVCSKMSKKVIEFFKLKLK